MEAQFSRFGAHHKTEGPETSLTFLGIEIDTIRLQLSLPMEKVQCLQDLLFRWRSRKAYTKKELESLLGHLCHAATVIRPGRVFLRNHFCLPSRVSNPCHFVRLNMDARADLAWWQCLLRHWNGLSFFPLPTPSFHVYSDASGSFGCGAVCSKVNQWFQLQWPSAWGDTGIAAKELVPIVIAAVLWGLQWTGQHVCFHSDNEAVVTVITRRFAKHTLLRCFFFYASFFPVQLLHMPYSRHCQCGRRCYVA